MTKFFNKKFFKYLACFLLVVLILFIFISPVQSNDEEKKSDTTKNEKEIKTLQIGIKKKIADCSRRSKKGDTLFIHYEGKLLNGDVFDSSYERGEPLSFTLGSGQVIKGWDQGLLGICEGEKRKLIIPADLAYGSRGAGPKIPPNSPLIFEVECTKIENIKQDL